MRSIGDILIEEENGDWAGVGAGASTGLKQALG